MEPEIPSTPSPKSLKSDRLQKALYILASLIVFIFAVDLMIASLQHLSGSASQTIIQATSNPFTGLFIGLLLTAMIQSSSTTTSLVVALVASSSVSIRNAIPIIMGANIGTTITSTIVALGFINKRKEFRRAMAAGTFHDFFNILTVIVLFPLEHYYGFLSWCSQAIAAYFQPAFTTGSRTIIPNWSIFGSSVDFLVGWISNGFVLVFLSFTLLFSSILFFRKLISGLLIASSPERFGRFFFRSEPKSFLWGVVTTAAIRSSTITTSVVVPIVANKIVTLRKASAFIMGANIGTTITAFIAAILNANTTPAVSIAFAHFLFNFIGVLLFFPIPFLRKIPLYLARSVSRLTVKYRLGGFLYILVVFFFMPFSLIYLNKGSAKEYDAVYRTTSHEGRESSYVIISKMERGSNDGEWQEYNNTNTITGRDPDYIVPITLKNNVLFVNQETYLFNMVGSCWNGGNADGPYQICVLKILPAMTLSPTLQFDSVYVFRRQYARSDSLLQEIYICKDYPLILKEVNYRSGSLQETREITALTRR